MKKNKIIAGILFCLFIGGSLSAATLKTVSTFETISIYWLPDSLAAQQNALVHFRETGTGEWREGLPMICNPIGETTEDITPYRGSIVNLTPDTRYEIVLTLEGTSISDTITAKTWSEHYSVSDTIVIRDRSIQYTVYDSGTPDGYLLIDGTNATIDVDNNYDQCIVVRGSYVIIRGFTLKNARKHGIRLINCHDVIIENCDISGWGEQDADGFGVNCQSGIFSESSSIKRIVIQRCKIHHPRYDSNSWAELNNGGYHPSGPQGIAFFNSSGNNVIRYNEIWSDSLHMFNDIIGAGTNGSFRGFPGPDSDIYSNYFANCWDDGIESEGGNRNTRIWGNYIEECFLPIANAATSIGPLYIWKNTSGRCYGPPGSYYGQDAPFIKMGYANSIDWMTGHMYIFNNTILQPNGEGAGGLGTSDDSNRYIKHCISLNNILHVKNGTANAISIRPENTNNSYDYDLYNRGVPSGQEPHGIVGTPTYIDGANFNRDKLTANFFLEKGTEGYDDGVVISNFADMYNGSAPDMGAFEDGDKPTEYGVNAYLVTALGRKETSGPYEFMLFQNYPNPFNPTTTIKFELSRSGLAKLTVYNILGEKVKVLLYENMRAGIHTIVLDGKDLSSGLYFYRLEFNTKMQIKRLLLIK